MFMLLRIRRKGWIFKTGSFLSTCICPPCRPATGSLRYTKPSLSNPLTSQGWKTHREHPQVCAPSVNCNVKLHQPPLLCLHPTGDMLLGMHTVSPLVHAGWGSLMEVPQIACLDPSAKDPSSAYTKSILFSHSYLTKAISQYQFLVFCVQKQDHQPSELFSQRLE